MTNGVGQKLKQQTKKLVKDIALETLKEPGRMAESAAKQVGVRSEQGIQTAALAAETPAPAQIETMKQAETAQRQATMRRLRSELEQEIKRVRLVKSQTEQQEEAIEAQEKEAMAQQQVSEGAGLAQPTAKPKRGLMARMGRVKQQQTERVAGRRSG